MNSRSVILAVETSSRIGSVALASEAGLLAESTFSAPFRHSAEIFPTLTHLLDRSHRSPADIAEIYISIGPGSFTGLRIAVAIAKSMHLAGSTRIVTVDSLDTIAANITDAAVEPLIQNSSTYHAVPDRLATILDAKRGQFYIAVYERMTSGSPARQEPEAADPSYRIPAPGGSVWQKSLPDCLMSAPEFVNRFGSETSPIHLLGDGLLHHRDKFKAEGIRVLDEVCWSPRAVKVHSLGHQKARCGGFADPLTLTPFYLRGPQVTLRKASAPPSADAS